MSTNGIKSNSILDAFLEFIALPVAARIIASKSVSPIQAFTPSPDVVVFGPTVFVIFPVLNTTPLLNGKLEPFLSK